MLCHEHANTDRTFVAAVSCVTVMVAVVPVVVYGTLAVIGTVFPASSIETDEAGAVVAVPAAT